MVAAYRSRQLQNMYMPTNSFSGRLLVDPIDFTSSWSSKRQCHSKQTWKGGHDPNFPLTLHRVQHPHSPGHISECHDQHTMSWFLAVTRLRSQRDGCCCWPTHGSVGSRLRHSWKVEPMNPQWCLRKTKTLLDYNLALGSTEKRENYLEETIFKSTSKLLRDLPHLLPPEVLVYHCPEPG